MPLTATPTMDNTTVSTVQLHTVQDAEGKASPLPIHYSSLSRSYGSYDTYDPSGLTLLFPSLMFHPTYYLVSMTWLRPVPIISSTYNSCSLATDSANTRHPRSYCSYLYGSTIGPPCI